MSKAFLSVWTSDDLAGLILIQCDLHTIRAAAVCRQLSKLGTGIVRTSKEWRSNPRNGHEVQLERWARGRHTLRRYHSGPKGVRCDGGVVAVDVSDSYLVSGSNDQLASVWDTASGRHVASLEHPDAVTSVALHGSRLATACRDGSLRVWSLPSGDPQRVIDGHGCQHGHVFAIAWTGPQRLLSGASDRTLRSWNAGNGACIGLLKGSEAVSALAVDESAGLAASPCRDYSVAVYATDTLVRKHTLCGHTRPVLSVAFSGSRVASGGCDGIRLWLLSDGGGACAFHVKSDGPVFAVALHGATLLSGAGSGSGVCVWDLEAQRVVARLHGRSAGSVCALAFDGKRVACGDSASLVPQVWQV